MQNTLIQLKELRKREQWAKIALFTHTLNQNKEIHPAILAEIAFAFARLGKVQEAEQVAKTALSLDNSLGLALRTLVLVALQCKNTKTALNLAQCAFKPPFVLHSAEEAAQAIVTLANVHKELDEKDKALKLTEESIRVCPIAGAYALKAFLYFELHKFDETIEAALESLKLYPKRAELWKLLATIYYNTNQIEKTLDAYEHALQIEPQNPDTLTSLGELYSRVHKLERAEELFRRAVDVSPKHAAAWANLAKHYYNVQKVDECIAAFKTSLQLNPDNVELLTNLAQLLLKSKQNEEGGRLLQKAYELNPTNDKAALSLALWNASQGETQLADSLMAEVVARNPDAPFVLQARAKLAYQRDQHDARLGFVQQAVANEFWLLTQQPNLTVFSDGTKSPMDVYDASETLIAVCQFLEQLKVPYFLIAGTLLGIVRDGDLLPHDKDADLGIAWDVDRNWLMDQFEKSEKFSINGLRPEPEVAEWNFSVFRIGTPIGVDLFFQKTSGDNWLTGFHAKPSPWLQRFKQRKLTTIEYKGHLLPIPENPEEYLEEVYGPEWRIPMTSYDTIVAAENLCSEAFISAKILGYDRLLEALQNRSWKKVLWYCEALKRFDNPPILDELAGWLRGALASTSSENDSKK